MQASDVTSAGVFRAEAIRDTGAIKAAFAEAGFTQDKIAPMLGIRHPAETMDVELVALRCAEPLPLHVLMRLFILAHPVPEKTVREVLPGSVMEDLFASGLLELAEHGVRSVANLAPYGDLLVASDFSSVTRGDLPEDHVLGVGPSSVTLANLTVRKEGGTIYDLGCGSGIQALLGATTAKAVTASDLSERALDFAALNGRLNGFDNIEWRRGSFFEPAGEERFDTVACNPPFVISPGTRFVFRDGGLRGDGVSELVARQAGHHLHEGGYASMLINWIQDDDQDWASRPMSWTKESGCDAWIIRSSDTEPVTYASNWLRQSEARDPAVYRQRLHEWVGYLRDAGIRRIASGALILRKRTGGENWQRADVMDGTRARGACGGHIREVFAAEDFLHEHPTEEAVLACRFRVPATLDCEQLLKWSPEKWVMRGASLSLSDGLPFSGNVDAPFLGILLQCSGERPLSAIVDEFLAGQTGDPGRIRAAIVNVVRQMARGAMLLPVNSARG